MTIDDFMMCVTKANQNTYKYALAYAFLEINLDSAFIDFDTIAKKVIEFYYLKAVQPQLVHTNNKKQQPIVVTVIERVMKEYGYDYSYESIPDDAMEKMVCEIVEEKNKGFFKYVLPCWEGAKKDDRGYYVYPCICQANLEPKCI